MKFEELMQRYKDGTATEEECQLVEEEISKSELINEYLNESLLDEPIRLEKIEGPSSEMKKVKKAVNRRFWKMGITVFALVMAVVLLVVFVGFPYYNSLFYNPAKEAEGIPNMYHDSGKDTYGYQIWPLLFNAECFLELNCPDLSVSGVKCYPGGFGKYDVSFNLYGRFIQDQVQFTTQIKKGEQVQKINDSYFFMPGWPNAGAYYDRGPTEVIFMDDKGVEHQEQMEDQRDYYREELRKLPESTLIGANISFPRDLTIEELLEKQKEWDGKITISWAAVRTSDSQYFTTMGFAVQQGGYVYETSEEFREKFPLLLTEGEHNLTAEDYRTHFKTMLQYMTYQGDFINAFADVNGQSPVLYQEALDYANEEGVQIIGAYVVGNRDDMIWLEQQEDINSFRVENMKLSVLQ